MSQQNSLDNLILEAIEDELANTPAPPLSKKEAWEQIRSQLSQPQNTITNKSKLILRRIGKITAAACLMMTVIIASLSFAKDGSAFSWFSKYLVSVKGSVTTIFVSSTDEASKNRTNNPPPPVVTEVEVDESLVYNDQMSLSDAQAATDFKIVVPEIIPDGYTLSYVNVIFSGNKKSREVELIYENETSQFSIIEYKLTGMYSSSTGFDNEDTHMKEMIIKGERGTYLLFKNGANMLMWSNADYQFRVKSRLQEEELIKMVQSM